MSGFAKAAAAWFVMCLAVVSPARSDDAVEAFYKGRQLNVIVGYGTGGGFDVYARIVSRHIGRFIPGSPNAIVQNMPGAGSLLAVNHLYNLAPKDGLTFAHFGRNILIVKAIGSNPNVRFDPHRLTWLGSSSRFADDAYILIVRKDAPVKSMEDVRKAAAGTLLIGGSAEGSTSNDVPLILRETIGLSYKLIAGYRDSAALFLAAERGEIHARMVDLSGVRTIKPQWLRPGGMFKAMVQFARPERHPMLADVPTARELALGAAERELIEFAEAPYAASRPFAAPPGLPPERARALQFAFTATHADAKFLEEARAAGLDISPVDASGVLKIVEGIESARPELIERYKKLFTADGR